MKPKRKAQRLKDRIADYEETKKKLKDPSSTKKPGSLKK